MAGKLRNNLLHLLTQKERDEKRRISLTELSHESGVTYTTANRWLNNDVSRFDAPVVERFCDYFKCEVGDLLYIDRTAS